MRRVPPGGDEIFGLDQRQAALAALAAGCLILVVVLLLRPGDDDATRDWVDAVWFYDLNTRQLFTTRPGTVPPAPAPSGKGPDGEEAGVRAHLMGCGDCSAGNRVIAYIERFPARSAQQGGATPSLTGRDHQIADPASNPVKWLPANSPEGQALRKSIRSKCQDKTVVQCFPDGEARFGAK